MTASTKLEVDIAESASNLYANNTFVDWFKGCKRPALDNNVRFFGGSTFFMVEAARGVVSTAPFSTKVDQPSPGVLISILEDTSTLFRIIVVLGRNRPGLRKNRESTRQGARRVYPSCISKSTTLSLISFARGSKAGLAGSVLLLTWNHSSHSVSFLIHSCHLLPALIF